MIPKDSPLGIVLGGLLSKEPQATQATRGTFTNDPSRDPAYLLWIWYEVTTETFDRSLPGAWFDCGGRVREWLPGPGEARGESIRYARKINDRVRELLRRFCLDTEESIRARDHVQRMTFEQQLEEFERCRPQIERLIDRGEPPVWKGEMRR